MPSYQPPEQGEGHHIQDHVGGGKKSGSKNGKEPNLDGVRQNGEEHGNFIGLLAGRRRFLCPLETGGLPGFRREHFNLDLLWRRFRDDRRHVFVHGFYSLLLPRWGTISNWHRRQREASAMSKLRPEAATPLEEQGCHREAAACGRRAIRRDFRQKPTPKSRPGEGPSRPGSPRDTPWRIFG